MDEKITGQPQILRHGGSAYKRKALDKPLRQVKKSILVAWVRKA
ncbi:hypothetical protein [Thioalkalivibrio denitrificans]|nr:hypothetical protein [Thioalkalivibrio denitrificans]